MTTTEPKAPGKLRGGKLFNAVRDAGTRMLDSREEGRSVDLDDRKNGEGLQPPTPSADQLQQSTTTLLPPKPTATIFDPGHLLSPLALIASTNPLTASRAPAAAIAKAPFNSSDFSPFLSDICMSPYFYFPYSYTPKHSPLSRNQLSKKTWRFQPHNVKNGA